MGEKIITFVFVVESCKGIIDISIIHVAVRNSYTGRFTAASIWEILSLKLSCSPEVFDGRAHTNLQNMKTVLKGEQKICYQISGTTCTNCDMLGVSGSSYYKILKTTEKSPKYNPCK